MSNAEVNLINLATTADQAKREFWRGIVIAFPVRTKVMFRHGGHWRVCEVLDHSQDRIKVLGISGSEYWVYWDRYFRAAAK